MIKLHISIYHDIVSATSVAFAGQGLAWTYLTRSVEHSQMNVYQLLLAQFRRDLTTFCKDTLHKLKNTNMQNNNLNNYTVNPVLTYMVFNDTSFNITTNRKQNTEMNAKTQTLQEDDGWMEYGFTSFLTVFQSYQDDGKLIIKGCMQWNSIYGREHFASSGIELGPLDQ